MIVKNARQYIEEHKKELAAKFDEEDQVTNEQHEKLCKRIRSGEIEGIIYPDGSTWTPR